MSGVVMEIKIGDIINTKKKHPCGSYQFEILRVGMDFRMRCVICDKQIWISRTNLEKRITSIIPADKQE